MPTLTVYGDTSDGLVRSENATYSVARSGSGATFLVDTTSDFHAVGQTRSSAYLCFELFLAFDTSSLDDTATVTAVELSLDGFADNSTTDFTMEVRSYDWGASLTSADWVAGASLGTHTLVASLSSASYSSGYMAFTESGTAFQSAINKTGFTRLLVASSRLRLGTTPTGNEYINVTSANETGTTLDPKLVITYSTNVDVTVAAQRATAPAAGVAPTVVINRDIAGVTGEATAETHEPSLSLGFTVASAAAQAASAADPPVVLLGDSVAVQPPAATAAAVVLAPVALVNITIAGVVASATSTGLTPVLTALYLHSKAIIRGGGAVSRRVKMSGGVAT